MSQPSIAIACCVALAVTGCGRAGDSIDTEGTWVGTITTEDDVTTVVNESGSVWGGEAELVEELSIGVENGPPEYMFGEIAWVHVDDAGIWVVDEQTPAVRLFAHDGSHVRDIGAEGEGPGEYTRPARVATAPDVRVFLVDGGTRRINTYAADGEFLQTLPLARGVVLSGGVPMAIDDNGSAWLVYRDYDLLDPVARRSPTFVVRAHSPDGPTAEPWPIPDDPVGQVQESRTRFSPSWVWNLTPSGELLSGRSDTYRFERRGADGLSTVVEMYGDPVRVSPGEVAYFARLSALSGTTSDAASTLPDAKPAFLALLGTSTGETWVLRQGPGFKVPDCNDQPTSVEEMLSGDLCWQDALFFDVFAADGRYLGSVDVPNEMREQIRLRARMPHLASDHVTAVAIDDAGTIMVKRYRLVLPGEQ